MKIQILYVCVCWIKKSGAGRRGPESYGRELDLGRVICVLEIRESGYYYMKGLLMLERCRKGYWYCVVFFAFFSVLLCWVFGVSFLEVVVVLLVYA